MTALKTLLALILVGFATLAMAQTRSIESDLSRGKDVVLMEGCEWLVIGEFEVTGVMVCDE